MAEDSKLINVCGLWKNESRNGSTYLSGSLGGVQILVFPVKEKRSDKSPDYMLCISEKKREEKQEKSGGTPF